MGLIKFLIKILPLFTLVVSFYRASPQFRQQADKMNNYAKVITVQNKLNEISELVGPLLEESTEITEGDLLDYVQQNTSKMIGSSYDASKDIWGMNFRFYVDETTLVISSAGPDRNYETEDDIFSSYEIEDVVIDYKQK